MEICECALYKDVVEKFRFFSLGTLHPLKPIIPVPENGCIAWKCNKANHEDFRPNKPILIVHGQEIENEEDKEPIESKWIPVLPGVISQKAVNESKRIHSPF